MEKFLVIFYYFNKDLEYFMLILRRGVMSYNYIDSWKNLTENLPAKEELFSELNNDETPDKD